ncbi:hypothetical protein INO88_15220, partial [Staphylococcus aureus]|nr:hypothetical protein [Staphylococcus aureus]
LNAFIKLLIPAKTFLKILPMIGKFVFVYSIKRVIEFSPAALLVGVIITLVGAFRFLIAPILAVMDFLGPLAARLVALVTKFGW